MVPVVDIFDKLVFGFSKIHLVVVIINAAFWLVELLLGYML